MIISNLHELEYNYSSEKYGLRIFVFSWIIETRFRVSKGDNHHNGSHW